VIRLEPLPRWLRVAIRAAAFTLAACFVASLLPIWLIGNPNGSAKPVTDGGLFWQAVAAAATGDRFGPSQYMAINDNLVTMAVEACIALALGYAVFWFGSRGKAYDDEPRRLRVPVDDS
jgi:hypothetical protein